MLFYCVLFPLSGLLEQQRLAVLKLASRSLLHLFASEFSGTSGILFLCLLVVFEFCCALFIAHLCAILLTRFFCLQE
jgi:hypothetical protein